MQHSDLPKDPHGIEILATYKYGSCSMSNSTGLAVPGIRWLGVHNADFAQFDIPSANLLPLGERERARALSLASRECMTMEPLWLYAPATVATDSEVGTNCARCDATASKQR